LEDFNALASSLAQGVGDVRGCLILSRDGLVLGAHPAEAEDVTTPACARAVR
jgi:predicted regulator of Ras-like GTPase activity (Roadblock/LC7/MglB family)